MHNDGRRKFLKFLSLGGSGLLLFGKLGLPTARATSMRRYSLMHSGTGAMYGGSLDCRTIHKYHAPLLIPPAMPQTANAACQKAGIDYYEIAVRQLRQQILPPGFPATTVWGYGSANHPGSFSYPSCTVETKTNRPVRVKWINDLKDATTGRYLPHLFAVDQTLHWANPAGGTAGRDTRPTFGATPGPYTGPVPMVPHLHGGHSPEESDGYPESWFLPAASNIPAGYATVGSHYDEFKRKFFEKWGVAWQPGATTCQYPNDQKATTLWYHDHTLGMTRLNVYAGPAGFYLLRGGATDLAAGVLPGPAPAAGDPPGTKYYEIPIVIQDRSFNQDGSLFYPDSRSFFDGFTGPYIPGSDIPPQWNAEFFGNAMVVNGRTWPYLNVEPRRYRLRLLNGCNSRFLILKMSNPAASIWQIGGDGGFLPAPAPQDQLLLAPAERADVIVDFTGLPPGTTLTLLNTGPDEPFGGGVPGVDFASANPDTTGQVMQFRVTTLSSMDTSTPPQALKLPAFKALGTASRTRQVSLNELDSDVLAGVGPRIGLLGTVTNDNGVPRLWMDAITENPAVGATEIWEIYNFTEDAHPVHIHETQFQILNRQPIGSVPRGPEPWESGFKDTVIAYPGEITRVKAKFDLAGRYVWHCHILEHEDNEMMRPFQIG